MRTLLVGTLLLVGSVLHAGCSSESTTTTTSSTSSTSSGGGSAPAANCVSRCEAKAKECGGPTDGCANICASATESEVACLEAASCSALAKSDGKCPEGSSSSSSSGGSSSSSGSSPGCKSGECLAVADCAACASSDDGTSSYPLCCDKGSTGNPKTCRNRKCCLNFGDECKTDADCCSNSNYKCKDSGGTKKCSP